MAQQETELTENTNIKVSLKQVLAIIGTVAGLMITGFTSYYAGQSKTEARFNAIENKMSIHEKLDEVKQNDFQEMKDKVNKIYDVVIKLQK